MKTFLVPTDFSDVSQQALQYLIDQLTHEKTQAVIVLLHVYDGTFSSDEPLVFEPMKGAEELVQEELQRFADRTPAPSGITIEPVALVGFPANEILHLVEKRKMEGICMGVRSKHELQDKVFGTVSSHVSRHADCPVILVPNGAKFTPYQNILVATETDIPVNSFMHLARLAEKYQSILHFLHVDTDGMDDFEETEVKLYQRINHLLSTLLPYEIRNLKADSVWSGITQYQQDYPVDLTVILPERHRFWERLIGLSHTKNLVLHSQTPVLVLPGKSQ
ncbi:MAG: universal stress protein [Saprospiraceae bacterium]|nr:universal stress protein [Saprospiraceae bacterium]